MTQAFNLSQLANNLNTSGQLDATDGLVGSVPVANGGTGASTLTANNVILGNGTSAVQVVAPSTSGNILTSNGTTWTSAAPTGSTAQAKAATLGALFGTTTSTAYNNTPAGYLFYGTSALSGGTNSSIKDLNTVNTSIFTIWNAYTGGQNGRGSYYSNVNVDYFDGSNWGSYGAYGSLNIPIYNQIPAAGTLTTLRVNIFAQYFGNTDDSNGARVLKDGATLYTVTRGPITGSSALINFGTTDIAANTTNVLTLQLSVLVGSGGDVVGPASFYVTFNSWV